MIYYGEITLEQIAYSVSQKFELSIYEMFKTTRKKHIVNARQMFCYMARINTKHSFQEIADYITKKGLRVGEYDHASVLHSVNKISDYVMQYPEDYRNAKKIEWDLKEKTNYLIVSDVNLLKSI